MNLQKECTTRLVASSGNISSIICHDYENAEFTTITRHKHANNENFLVRISHPTDWETIAYSHEELNKLIKENMKRRNHNVH